MVVFVFIVIAVIVVSIVVRNKKRDEKVKFLLNESDSHYFAVKIKDALVKDGYKVTGRADSSEEPDIEFEYDGLPVGRFNVSKGIETGGIYFSSGHRGLNSIKSTWEICSVSVILGHLYAAKTVTAGINILVVSWHPVASKGHIISNSRGYDEIPQLIEIAARIMADSGLEYEIVRKANSSVDDD
jgi:hypothetical protein